MVERKRFLLRLDPATYDAIERWAGDEFRSVNAQIEHLLNEALRGSGRTRRSSTTDRGGDRAAGSDRRSS